MYHNRIDETSNSGDHWAVAGGTKGNKRVVLVQLQENGEQVRVSLNADQAEMMGKMLLRQGQWLRGQEADRNHTQDTAKS